MKICVCIRIFFVRAFFTALQTLPCKKLVSATPPGCHIRFSRNFAYFLAITRRCACGFGVLVRSFLAGVIIIPHGGTYVVVPQYYMSCPCVYGLQQYGHLNNSCPLCFLFSFGLKIKNR